MRPTAGRRLRQLRQLGLIALCTGLIAASCTSSERQTLQTEQADRPVDTPETADADEPAPENGDGDEAGDEDEPVASGQTNADRSPANGSNAGPSTADDPSPLIQATFSHRRERQEDTYDVRMLGVVEGASTDFADEPGRCYFVLGTLTPTETEFNVSDAFSAPRFYLTTNGVDLEPMRSECDATDVEAAGYDWILHASATVGTSYEFFESFFVPDISPTDPSVVIAGDPAYGDARYFTADILPSIPTPPPPTYGANEFMESAPPMTGTTITMERSFQGATWERELVALVETDVSASAPQPGTCVTILSRTTLTRVEDDIPSTVPGGFLLVDGRLNNRGAGECDSRAFDAAGWTWYITADVALGEPVFSYEEFFLPADRPNVINAVGADIPASNAAQFFIPPEIRNSVPRAD